MFTCNVPNHKTQVECGQIAVGELELLNTVDGRIKTFRLCEGHMNAVLSNTLQQVLSAVFSQIVPPPHASHDMLN